MMDAAAVANLRALMGYEAARTAPPRDFPRLPDVPGGRYTDPRFHALEREHVWRKSWLLAAHMDEVPQHGCFKLWETAGQPVVIVHARSGEINAFYNTCSHRGAPVVTQESGRRARMTCKYHGWVYDDEGKLVSIRDAEDFDGLDFSCRSLRQVRCERFGKLIFVTFDPAAPALTDWLGPFAEEWAEFQFDNTRLVDQYIWDLDCNWKIAMEANMEVYHVPNIHPTTVALGLDHRRNVNTLYPHGHGRMVAPGWENKEGENYRAAKVGQFERPEINTVGEIGRTCTQSYNLFPNWVSPLGPTGYFILNFWPNGPTKSKLEVRWFGPDWGEGPRPAFWDATISYLNSVLEEDTEFGTWIQKSQESYGFTGVPLSYQEARIYHWHQAADALIGAENIPPELRVVPVIGDEWIAPNDPRLGEMALQEAAE
ncbi:aromatic ring-hydroxylating oxygenase subunit alpha [Sphingomonas radiodurans]|uniref:aromatic ring-hydroxylating oxygenase subunit alpha n=1 Tax=Sphingomonas radiodurans TaxID=2890321 RepID=UPI001E5A08A2|nr:aromatic ring-hydroxylating dioxygenase subunit alpha [Sphingomonas radiodurans]WBH17797.1 aromatic ring-hydroxylating dioxygenase subunit alpha [Sphingomonas radiodurans]